MSGGTPPRNARSRYATARLAEYPRYFEALRRRLEDAAADPAADADDNGFVRKA